MSKLPKQVFPPPSSFNDLMYLWYFADEVDDEDGNWLLADPWWTIHFGGQANHVGTSHIPLCSNFNRHIFITPITSNHIILTYPLHSHQKYHNCRVQIFKMSPSSRMLLTYTGETPEKEDFSWQTISVFVCSQVFRLGWNVRGWTNTWDKRTRDPDGNYQQQILGSTNGACWSSLLRGNIICRVILVSPFLLVLPGTQLLTCPSRSPTTNTLFPGQKLLLNDEIFFSFFSLSHLFV